MVYGVVEAFPDHTHCLRQYILQPTVANSTSLCNILFHCLAIGWQLQAVGATYYIFAVFLKENFYLHIRMGITVFKIFIWGGISSDIRSEVMFLAPLTRHH